MAEPTVIVLVTAPGIPSSEREALEAHVREAILDLDYTLVLNYEAVLEEVVIPENSKVMIAAPGLSVSEVSVLRGWFDKARFATEPQDRVVVINYEVRIEVMSPNDRQFFGTHEDFYNIDTDQPPELCIKPTQESPHKAARLDPRQRSLFGEEHEAEIRGQSVPLDRTLMKT